MPSENISIPVPITPVEIIYSSISLLCGQVLDFIQLYISYLSRSQAKTFCSLFYLLNILPHEGMAKDKNLLNH